MTPLQLTQAYCNDEKGACKKDFLLTETPAAEQGLVALKKRASKKKAFLLNKFPAALNRSPAADE